MTQNTIIVNCRLNEKNLYVWGCAKLIVSDSSLIKHRYIGNHNLETKVGNYLKKEKTKLKLGENCIPIPVYIFGSSLKSTKVYCGKAPQTHTRPILRSARAIKIKVKAYSNTANLLARLLYSEAAGDSHHEPGLFILRAIAWVIKNRVTGNTHPNSYSSVIYYKGNTGKPHFRGLPGGDNVTNWNQFPNINDNWSSYYTEAKRNAILVANEVVLGKIPDPTFGSEWFRFRKNHTIDPTVFIEKK